MAYAHISGVETDTTSVISPDETRKILESKGVIPRGRGSSWLARVANKFVDAGRYPFSSLSYIVIDSVDEIFQGSPEP